MSDFILPLPSPRLITAGEKSDTFTDRLGLLMKRHLEGMPVQFPSLYTVPEVITKSRYSEEQVLQWGYIGEITFLVLVPEIGACRVPKVALSHLLAGAAEYSSDRLPEHYSGQLAGPWSIKRDRLRILAESWDRFRRDSLALVDAVFPDWDTLEALRKLPAPEVERWEAASAVEGRSNRLVSHSYAGLTGTSWATLEQFCDEVNTRLARWFSGNYEIVEAAQILADRNPGVVAEELCRQMEQAVHNGELIYRRNGLPVRPSGNFGERIWNSTVRQDDVNEWLMNTRAGYQLNYPYEMSPKLLGSPPVPQAAPVANESAIGSIQPTKPAKVDKGWMMKKGALILKHAHQWRTISGDFHSASENGLSKAAKAPGHGEWFEAAALDWARQRGKLTEEKQKDPANLATIWTGTKHTMQG